MEKPFKQLAKELLTLVGILVVAFIVLDKTTSIFHDSNANLVKVPIIVSPVKDNSPDSQYKETVLISEDSPYVPNRNLLQDKNLFLKDMTDIAMVGKFLEAELIIQGSVENNLLNFLSINIDYTSGVYGVEDTTCNFQENCAFKNKDGINLTVDLMDKTLLSGNRIKLWNAIQPQPNSGKASIAKILVLPFDQNSSPSSKITSLKIKYRCEESGCQIMKCDKSKYSTLSASDAEYQCAVDNFGKEAAKNLSKNN